MQTLSEEEFKRRYGSQALAAFDNPQNQPKQPGFIQRVKESYNAGYGKAKQGVSEVANSKNPVNFMEGVLKGGAGAVEATFSPISAAVEPAVKPVVNYAADKLSNNASFQKFATSKAGEVTSRALEDVNNLNTIAGAVAGGMETPKVAGKVGSNLRPREFSAPNPIKLPEAGKNFVKDVVPNSDRIINHQVTQALDLTPGDLNNIARSTGHEVGRFLADENLLGNNKEITMSNVENFFKENYANVRSEIGKVNTVYKPNQVPRYVEALKSIKQKVDNVPGLQKVGVEVNNLLNKKNISLKDVQRVKELMDDHFSIYKATGDVGDNIAKEGLNNIRHDIQHFIEEQVNKHAGTDIKELNNNVSTAKGIMDAVETRNPRGLTRSNFKIGDLAVAGYGFSLGGPLGATAAIFFKKLYDSPSVKLRFSKWLDTVTDAQKARMSETLDRGQIPPEFDQFVKKKGN